MKIAVWDTYVQRNDGIIAHFDILVPHFVEDSSVVFRYGDHYLKSKAFSTKSISTNECKLCHIESATEDMIRDIKSKGYSIIEMENCN